LFLHEMLTVSLANLQYSKRERYIILIACRSICTIGMLKRIVADGIIIVSY